MLAAIQSRTLSSHLLSKNIKIRKYKNIILPVVQYGCETWSLTLREEHRLRVFENRVLRRIFGPMRDEVMGEIEENCIMRSFITSTLSEICYSDADMLCMLDSTEWLHTASF
jgi:hypothetical protein